MNTAREFTDRLLALVRGERNTLADFILVLAELDRRELFRELGYASLFQFLQREIGLSDGLAYFRMKACRLVRDFPEVVEPLRDGRLCVTNVVELSKVITPENRHEVLPRYFHVSKRKAEAITVSIQPKAVVPTRSVATPVRAPALALEAASRSEPGSDADVGTEVLKPVVVPAATATAPVVATPPRRGDAEPLTDDLARFHVTVPARLLEKLAAARDALSHVKPGATDAEVLEAALDALLDEAAKRKGLTDRPLKTPRASSSGAVPAHVKRVVWKRDKGRCQAPLKSGGICGSTHQLEFHHRRARARRAADGREHRDPMQGAQSRSGAGRLRGRLDGAVCPAPHPERDRPSPRKYVRTSESPSATLKARNPFPRARSTSGAGTNGVTSA